MSDCWLHPSLFRCFVQASDHSNVTYVVLRSHKKATYVVTTKSILMRNHFNVPFVHIAVVVVMHWMVICAFIQVLIKPTLNILCEWQKSLLLFYPWEKFRTHNRMLWSSFHTNYDYSLLEVQLSRAYFFHLFNNISFLHTFATQNVNVVCQTDLNGEIKRYHWFTNTYFFIWFFFIQTACN